jgi:hypothetical protein
MTEKRSFGKTKGWLNHSKNKEPGKLNGRRYAFIQPPGRMCGVLTEIVNREFDPNG